jgi:uncharacterized protein (DUF305 family)
VNTIRRSGLAAASLLAVLSGCASAPKAPPTPPASTAAAPAAAPAQAPAHPADHAPAPAATPAQAAAGAQAAAASAHHHHEVAGAGKITIPAGALFTEADVRFMQGMIAHHAQAIHMSRLAAARGANPRLVRFAQKIDLSQAGEITQMQEWLRANGQFAPDTSSWRGMTMHGMLTAEEIARLEAARGPTFDRLFLEYMIRHHEGALKMVADLFATPRAGQDVDVSVLANDVESTQTAEIGLMRQMLTEM